ncbi:MAG: hypothetical protein HYT19_00370 [Candidatus Nealsonbacteria bacterium]|nr:hypothetical protein [Candidatus Nealsonbacteria bacterium]
MQKKGLRTVDVKLELYEMIELVFSGLREEKGVIRAGPGNSEFPTRKTYKAIHCLSKEFPNLFPDYWVTDYLDFPHSKHLEDILFDMGAWGLLTLCGPRMDLQRVAVKMKKVMAESLLKCHGEGKIRKLLPIVERFNKLMAAED